MCTNISVCNFAVSASFDNFRFIKTFKTAYMLASKTKIQHHTEYFFGLLTSKIRAACQTVTLKCCGSKGSCQTFILVSANQP